MEKYELIMRVRVSSSLCLFADTFVMLLENESMVSINEMWEMKQKSHILAVLIKRKRPNVGNTFNAKLNIWLNTASASQLANVCQSVKDVKLNASLNMSLRHIGE